MLTWFCIIYTYLKCMCKKHVPFFKKSIVATFPWPGLFTLRVQSKRIAVRAEGWDPVAIQQKPWWHDPEHKRRIETTWFSECQNVALTKTELLQRSGWEGGKTGCKVLGFSWTSCCWGSSAEQDELQFLYFWNEASGIWALYSKHPHNICS